jgi:hypothetical protein
MTVSLILNVSMAIKYFQVFPTLITPLITTRAELTARILSQTLESLSNAVSNKEKFD